MEAKRQRRLNQQLKEAWRQQMKEKERLREVERL